MQEKIVHIKYSQKLGRDFTATLNKRVRAYFKENSISKYANTNMKIKTVFMISLFYVPLGFLLSGMVQSVWLTGLLYFLMGLGTAGIGLSIMHDANHGAYSKNDRVNKLLGGIVSLVGGYAPTWRMQHNVLHHTYTNVHGYDEDISPPGFLRFSPNEERKKIHNFQHLYAWFFYGLMTFSWITTKDFRQLYRYRAMGITDTEKSSFNVLLTKLILAKVFYYVTVLVLPMIIIDIAWYWFPIFIFTYHFAAGLILAVVFQPAHVIPETEFVDTKGEHKIEENFAIHQMKTTANFAPKSRILYWLIGGLNYQVEHHLFPNICHVHYKKLSKIVKETAEEYGVPYNTHSTFFRAIAYHTRMLKTLGQQG